MLSRTTTWVFRAGPGRRRSRRRSGGAPRPLGGAGAALVRRRPRPVRLPARPRPLLHDAAALDTGSVFEGMGARARRRSRASPSRRCSSALLVLARAAGSLSLVRHARRGTARRCGRSAAPSLVARRRQPVRRRSSPRTRRIPVDDPNTHLELTMIHEVMVLDHGGPAARRHPLRRRGEAVRVRRHCWCASSCRGRDAAARRLGALPRRRCSRFARRASASSSR